MSKSVKVIDHGWNRIEREFRTFEKSELVVGVLDSEVAYYAAVNEFGTEKTDHIPARPFMRNTFEDKSKEINELYYEEAWAVIDGKSTASRALNRIGLHIQGLIQKTIRSGVDPANADSTKEQKGHSKTLIGGSRSAVRDEGGKKTRYNRGKKKGQTKFKYQSGGRLMKSISYEIR